MKFIKYPAKDSWENILKRPVFEQGDLEKRVQPIMDAVKQKGDQALKEFGEKFDKVSLRELLVSKQEIREAKTKVSEKLQKAILQAKGNIERFHQSQKEPLKVVETQLGIKCWRKSVAISKVGLYIPGGTAPLFSTILMLGVPASIAGCEEIILCTPPAKDGSVHPAIIYTADLLGIKQIFKVGGAQAVAAMAYGTESIPQVYKIFGPGNQYVTMAKQLIGKEGIAIDMPAGPSEVAVVVDESAPAAFAAADLLSQAEHGVDSQVLLVSKSEAKLKEIEEELEKQLSQLPREEIARAAIANSRSILLKDEAEIVDLINAYAPEHLILAIKNDEEVGEQIQNAGSVFLGHYTPESVGDYASGTNHTLPTNGFAKAYSGVSLDSFVKKITFQKLNEEGIRNLGPVVETMAEAEELVAHAKAVSIRLASLSNES
ncbi:MAG: histidinol dehydrogenase [Bacteroidota bacterium]